MAKNAIIRPAAAGLRYCCPALPSSSEVVAGALSVVSDSDSSSVELLELESEEVSL